MEQNNNIPQELKPDVANAVHIIQEMEKRHILANLFKLSPETRIEISHTFLKNVQSLTNKKPVSKLPGTRYFNAIQAYWLGEYAPQAKVREYLVKALEHLLILSQDEYLLQIEKYCKEIDHYLFEKAEESLLNKSINNLLKVPDTTKLQLLEEFHRTIINTMVHSGKKDYQVSEGHLQKLRNLLRAQYELPTECIKTLIIIMKDLLCLPWGIQLKLIVSFYQLTEKVIQTKDKSLKTAKKKKDDSALQEKLKQLQAHAVVKPSDNSKKGQNPNLSEAELKLYKKAVACRNMPLDIFFDQHLAPNKLISEALAEAMHMLTNDDDFYYLDELQSLNAIFERQKSGAEIRYFTLDTQEAEIINEIHNRYGSIFRGVLSALDKLGRIHPKLLRTEESKQALAVMGMRSVPAVDSESYHYVHIKAI